MNDNEKVTVSPSRPLICSTAADTENTFGHFQAWLESKNIYDEFISDETTNERMSEIIKRYDLET